MRPPKRYGKKTDLALVLWVKLARAFSVFDHRTAEHIRTFGLTQAQFGALECLGHKGPLTLGELCRKQLVSGGNMTVVVDNLEREKLVERVRNKKDRRTIVVRLTPKGRDLFDRIFRSHAEYVAALSSVLNEREQVRLSSLLKKLGRGVAVNEVSSTKVAF
jgi:MarR family 2-MHQ and catechol resistance regulon transcriptional repressor